MRETNRFGLAAGLAAALAFAGTAHAQTSTGSAGSDTAAPSSQSDQSTSRPSERTGSPGSAAAPSEQGTGASAAPSEQGAGTSTTQPSPQGSAQTGTGAAESGTATGAEQSGMAGTQPPKISKSLANDLEKLHATNQAEIHMGQMAEQQAQSPEVKDYGRKLVDDHQKLDEKLQSEASNVGVNLEGKEYQKALKDSEKSMQKLQGKSGAAFDKEFLSIAEKGHKKAEKDTSKAAKEARKDNQETLAALFSQADTGIKSHANEAKRISKDVQKEGSKRQGRTPPSESGTGTTGGSSSSQQQESGSMGSSTGTTGMGSGSAGTPGH